MPKKVMEKGDSSVRKYIDEIMEPYSESYEKQRYIETTKEELEEQFKAWKERVNLEIVKIKTEEDYIKCYYKSFITKKGNRYVVENINMTLPEWVKEWENREDDLDENGNLTSTFNQESFYDWYTIGGRWSGILKIPIDENEELLNKIEEKINDDNDSVEYNSVKISLMLDRIKKINEKIVIMEKGKKEMAESVTYDWNGFGWADLLREFVKHQDLTKEESEFYDKVKIRVKEYIQKYEFNNPYVLGKIIDTEGEIFEGKNYGWFGVSDNIIDPMQWIKEYIEILEKYKEDYMVSLDCHV